MHYGNLIIIQQEFLYIYCIYIHTLNKLSNKHKNNCTCSKFFINNVHCFIITLIINTVLTLLKLLLQGILFCEKSGIAWLVFHYKQYMKNKYERYDQSSQIFSQIRKEFIEKIKVWLKKWIKNSSAVQNNINIALMHFLIKAIYKTSNRTKNSTAF